MCLRCLEGFLLEIVVLNKLLQLLNVADRHEILVDVWERPQVI